MFNKQNWIQLHQVHLSNEQKGTSAYFSSTAIKNFILSKSDDMVIHVTSFQLGSFTLHTWAAEVFLCKMCHLRCKRLVRFDKIVKNSGFAINLLSTWHLGICIYHHVPARRSTLPTKMYTMCGIAFLKYIVLPYLELHS